MITFRDVKVFLVGMITAFFIALVVYNVPISEQQIIGDFIQDSVIASVVALIIGTILRIGLSIFKGVKPEKIGE